MNFPKLGALSQMNRTCSPSNESRAKPCQLLSANLVEPKAHYRPLEYAKIAIEGL